jgi:hypothetical protein
MQIKLTLQCHRYKTNANKQSRSTYDCAGGKRQIITIVMFLLLGYVPKDRKKKKWKRTMKL